MFDDFTFELGMPLTDWTSILSVIAVYLAVVFLLKEFMKSRQKLELNMVGPIHNFLLCGLSLMMFVGILYEMINTYSTIPKDEDPLEAMLCDTKKRLTKGGEVFWFTVFFYSKFYELLDTVIIVLKKRPVIFLHVYHHCITIVLTFVMLDNMVAVQWIAITANCMVHIPMYYYYGVSALGQNVWWKKYITMFQIIQFVVDLLGNGVGFYYHYAGYNCSGALWSWWFGQGVLFSFLVLFIFFYRSTYAERKQVRNAGAVQDKIDVSQRGIKAKKDR